jgi:Family of unknown function (DUF5681)
MGLKHTQPDSTPAEHPATSQPRQRGGFFQKGASGNPKGRPAGSRNRATLAAEAMLDGKAEEITQKVIVMALEGDSVAIRLCMERLLPVRRERPISAVIPELRAASSASAKLEAIIEAVAAGRLLPSEGEKLANLLAAERNARERDELEQRVAALEHARESLNV